MVPDSVVLAAISLLLFLNVFAAAILSECPCLSLPSLTPQLSQLLAHLPPLNRGVISHGIVLLNFSGQMN